MKNPAIIALIIVLLIPVGILLFYKGNKSDGSATAQGTATPTASASATATQQDPADVTSAKQVILKTSKGDIRIDLFDTDAPRTVKNFVTLGKRGYYNGVIFHRVIKDFVIQGGDPTGTGTGGESIYGKKFNDEINSHKIVKGSVAMANAGKNTNGSQFFIVTESAQPSLDGSYTNFGQVSDDASMSVVQAIAAVETDSNDRPKEDVKIVGFEIVK